MEFPVFLSAVFPGINEPFTSCCQPNVFCSFAWEGWYSTFQHLNRIYFGSYTQSQKPFSHQERNMLLGMMPTQHTLQNGWNSVWRAIQTPVQPYCQYYWNSATALPSTISVKNRTNVSWQIPQNPYDYFKPCFETHTFKQPGIPTKISALFSPIKWCWYIYSEWCLIVLYQLAIMI